jgi:hypothetical protein
MKIINFIYDSVPYHYSISTVLLTDDEGVAINFLYLYLYLYLLRHTTSGLVSQDKQGGHKIGASKERAQSNLRMKPGWTYSRGAARDSRSSMYKCI